MTTTTTTTPAPTVEWKRTDYYNKGFQMYIECLVDGRVVGEIRAIYHYKSNRMSDLVVTCGKREQDIAITPALPARKALTLAKQTLLRMAGLA